jgi:hypothetical protein
LLGIVPVFTQTPPIDSAPLHDCGPFAELRGLHGGPLAGGPASDAKKIELVGTVHVDVSEAVEWADEIWTAESIAMMASRVAASCG